MKPCQNNENFNLNNVLQNMNRCLISLKQYIKVKLTLQILEKNEELVNWNDVQKQFDSLCFSKSTQCQILQDILTFDLEKKSQSSFQSLEYKFEKFINNDKMNSDMIKIGFQEFEVQYANMFITYRRIILQKQKTNIPEITDISGEYQKQQIFQKNSFDEMFQQLQSSINENFRMLQVYHIDDILKISKPIESFIYRKLNFDENITYWMRFIKIRFQIQMLQILNDECEQGLNSYINETFLFNFKNWKWVDGNYQISQYYHMDVKNQAHLVNDLEPYIQIRKLIQNSLLQFFENEEIKNLMEQVQVRLSLPRNSRTDFLYTIKFVQNPDYLYFCETIRDFGIIINLYQIIELYKGQMKDNVEFREVLVAYITVITIQGWTQLQLLKSSKKKILTYAKNLDSQDQQFLLTHMIFGQTDGKSNLKAMNKHIAAQINNFQTVERLQNYLKSYTNEGYILEQL